MRILLFLFLSFFLTSQSWALPECPKNIWGGYKEFHNCYTNPVKYKNGDKYWGEWRNNRRHGQGTYTWTSGDKYVGEWRDHKMHGRGTSTFPDGSKHVGEWRDDKRHGQGTLTYANGDKYVGEFNDGKRTGQGTYTFANGDKYVGEFNDAKKHGQGTYTHANGNKYVGGYKDDKQHGQGTYTFANGDKYIGGHKDDKFHGQGTYTWADGTKYVGGWNDKKKHGQGTITFAVDNEFYEESTYQDRKIKKGDRFVGQYENDYPKGDGIYYHADGTIEEGYWERYNLVRAKETPKQEIEKQIVEDDGKLHNAASGSGFAITNNGFVVTNNHVINGCTDVLVHHKGEQIKTNIVAYDPVNDLALLKGDFNPNKFFTISNSNAELMQDIFVAGFPFGNQLNTSVKVTKGIVSSLSGLGNNYSNIQIDAALQPGNSGGPIVDEKGNVIGVAVAKMDLKLVIENFGVVPEGTNFGIKSSVLKNFLLSNSIALTPPNEKETSKKDIAKKVTDATYFLSCWMTTAQIKEMRSKKVIFDNLGIQ